MTGLTIHETELPGVLLIEPRVFRDERGFFVENFNVTRFAAAGLPTEFVQDNRSRSSRSVVRGLHYQLQRPQGKLVTAVTGSIFDVAVDIRRGSPTFGRWTAVTLSEQEPRSLWIPPGFAHGFQVLSEYADVLYKCTTLYDPSDERGIAWNDEQLAIAWPLTPVIHSARDAELPRLRHLVEGLPEPGRD